MSAGEEYVAHLVASIEGSFDQAKDDAGLNTCPHGDSRVTCGPCLDAFIDDEAALADIEEANEDDA